ncbi:putative polyketide synthase [Hypoxylon crocopeplum]|nr:putative polyketide synthase [Hypoxylon crocopeplum]
MAASKFEAFNAKNLTYRTINGHPLKVAILTPKELDQQESNEYPILVHWHGGGFIAGHRLHEDWFALWLVELALEKKAIIIAPDYRLLPEAKGTDILEDVDHFWTWMTSDLVSVSESWHARPDLSKILCCGQSSGGWLSVQSAILCPQSNIKAIISISAPLNADVPQLTVPAPRTIMGTPARSPGQAAAAIRSYKKSIRPGAVRTVGDPTEMWDMVLSVAQQGALARFLGTKEDKRLDIMSGFDKVDKMPPIWAIHGQGDTIIPAICSLDFVVKLEKTLAGTPVHLTLESGDHSFDVGMHIGTSWVQKGCKFIEEWWP